MTTTAPPDTVVDIGEPCATGIPGVTQCPAAPAPDTTTIDATFAAAIVVAVLGFAITRGRRR